MKIFKMFSFLHFRRSLEEHVKHGQAEVLRGAGSPLEDAHGKISGLPLPTSAQADLHCGRQEVADLRVQDPDEEAAGGDEAAVVQRRRGRKCRRCFRLWRWTRRFTLLRTTSV